MTFKVTNGKTNAFIIYFVSLIMAVLALLIAQNSCVCIYFNSW